MPGETVLDRLVTVLGFDTDLSGLRRFDDKVRDTRKKLDDLSSGAFNIGRGLAVVGGAATGAFGLAARQAIQWESDFTGVRKTVEATEEEFAALESVLRQMARDEVPLPVGELAKLAELAGQLGIETANIPEFVKTIAQLGTTTNLTSEEGAQALARFANITNMAQGDFDRMGATIVDLGNNFATTEQEIVGMALRLAGAGELIGLTEAQILSISTALTSVGINAEAGGTAFSRVFVEMDKAVKEGGDTLDAFGKVIGKSGGEFAGTFTLEGPDQAIVEFIGGLQRIEADGENVHLVLEELGFDTVRIRDALLRSAGAGDLMAGAMERGTQAWDENLALTREAELRYDTMASSLTFAKNKLTDMAISVGNVLAPILIDFVQKLEPFIASITSFVQDHPGAVKWLAGLAAALLALGTGLIGIGAALKGASILLGLLQGIGGFIGLIASLGLGPIIAILAAVAGIALVLIHYWDEIKAFFSGFWEGFQSETDGIKQAFARVRGEIERVVEKLGLFKNEAKSAEDASKDAGNAWGRAFGAALATVLDAAAVLIRGVTDLAIGLAWVLKFIGVPEALAVVWDALKAIANGVEALFAGVWWVVDAFWALDAAIMGGVRALVGLFDIDLFAQGQAMLQSFIDGFMSKVGELQGAITGALQDVRDLLPFSDAKRGPLADLTASGQAFLDTFAAGVKQAGNGVLNRALRVELAGTPAIQELTAPNIPGLQVPALAGTPIPEHPRVGRARTPAIASGPVAVAHSAEP